MIIRLILFLTTFLLILGGTHSALYFSIVRFFPITTTVWKLYLIIALSLLGFSFFLSAMLVRTHLGFIANFYYAFSGFWIGLLAHLLVACAILWVIAGVLKLTDIPVNFPATAVSLFLLVTAFSLYGVWNAFQPQIVPIEVSLKNLPGEWKGKTIVQLSDTHLGPVHRVRFMNRVTEKTNSLNPDLILITGDLFDGMDGDLTPFIKPLSSLKAKHGVYFVTGNHEGYLNMSEPLDILSKASIRVLDDEVVDINGLQIVGISYPVYNGNGSKQKKEVFESKAYNPEKPTILMYHTPTNVTHENKDIGRQQSSAYWTPDLNFSFAKKMKVDLQLSGHSHQGQFFPFNLVARLIYGKYYHGLNHDGDFSIYTTSGTGTWGPPLRTFTKSEIVAITLK